MPETGTPSPEQNRDAERSSFRQAYLHVRGSEPSEEELDRLIEAQHYAPERFAPVSLETHTAKGVTHADVGQPAATTMPAVTLRPAQTWLTDDELREAESARWLASTHGVRSIVDALDWYARYRPVVATAPPIKACIEEFQIVKRCEGHRPLSLYVYHYHLVKFAAEFGDCPPVSITPKEIATYLRQWTVPATLAARWQTLATFFAWTLRMGYTLENPVFAAMRKPKTRPPERLVATPAETRFILRKTKFTDAIGYWALSFFGGLRTKEIKSIEKLPNRWTVVRFGPGIIDLPATVTKTAARVVPISPVLREWLHWIQQRNAPFMPKNYWFKTTFVRRAALARRCGNRPQADGTVAPDRRIFNIGRRSYISYRLALRDASYAEVADAVGNYEEIIRKHYHRKVSREDALKYFALTPSRV